MLKDQGSLKLGATFMALGVVAILLSFTGYPWEMAGAMAWVGLAFVAVGLAYLFGRPHFFLKRANGVLSTTSRLIYGPFLILNLCGHSVFRRLSREHLFDEICENLYLGGRLYPSDSPLVADLKLTSVLDLCAEFSESAPFRNLSYLCLPTLDACAPSVEQLEQGVVWMMEKTAAGPVYVHCALGRGRSATMVAAYLVASGRAATVAEAVEFVAERRPQIGLTKCQRRRLEEFAGRQSSERGNQ